MSTSFNHPDYNPGTASGTETVYISDRGVDDTEIIDTAWIRTKLHHRKRVPKALKRRRAKIANQSRRRNRR